MNTNIILDGFNAMLKQLIAASISNAVKPLEERIAVLEAGEWTKTQHIVVKEIQPLQDRVIALEIQQDSLALACQHIAQPLQDRVIALEINQTLVSSAKINLADLVAELVGAYDYVKRNEVVDLVDTVVTNAIDNYDFSESFDFENAIENYDFREIVEGSMPEDDEALTQDKVQQMIDESLDNLTINRN
jgi:hypothetical protein